MKKAITTAVLTLALALICSHALAVDFSERAYYSIYEMRSSSTMYAYTEGDGSNGLPYDYTPIGTLPAGTPVSTRGKVYGNYQHISYIDGDDHWAYVAVDRGTVKDAFTILDVGIGYRVKIPVAAARAGAEMVFDYVSWRYGVDPNMADVRRGLRGGSAAQPTPTPEPITESFYSIVNAKGSIELVEISRLGLTETLVRDSTGEHAVATADLLFQTNAPANQRVAWIVSNTGKVNMRRQAGADGRVIKQCSAGLMVTVFDLGEKYTGVICENTEGYVLTSALGFPAAQALSGVALTSYQGSTEDDRHKINLRAKASAASRRLAQFGCGVPAEVLVTEDDWSEVIIEGWHGYIQNGFLQMHLPPIPVLITPETPANAELNEKLWSYLETVWLPTRDPARQTMSAEEIRAFLDQMQQAGFAFPQGFLTMMAGEGAGERPVSYVLTQTSYTQLGDYLHFTVVDQYRLYQLMKKAGAAAYQDDNAQHPALPTEDSPKQADVLADCRAQLAARQNLSEDELDRMHVLIRFIDSPGAAAHERVLTWQLDWLDAEGDTAFQPHYRCSLVVGGGEWQIVNLLGR